MIHGMLTATLALGVQAVAPARMVLSDTVPPVRPARATAAAAGPRLVDRFGTASEPVPVLASGTAGVPDGDGSPAVPEGRAGAAPGVAGAGSSEAAVSPEASTSLVAPALAPVPLAADTPVKRTRAVEHSDAYYTRLTIHRIGSYAMLPLFGAEWYLGQRLINTSTSTPPSWVKPTHRAVAYGIYTIFGVNTVTGLWNAWEARNDTDGRARRWIHVATMLASDAGFVATAATVNQAKLTLSGAQRHRDIAIASISLSAASTVFMWLTK